MKISLSNIRKHKHYDSAVNWGKLISITGGTQIVVQAAGLLSGILIVNLLTVKEFAYYTIANAILGVLTSLSDSGVTNGVMIEGGKVWQDKEKLGRVIATGIALRKKFAIYAFAVSFPILIYMLLKQSASYITIITVLVALIPTAMAALSDSILETVPKLHLDIKPLQKNQFLVAVLRTTLNFLLLFVFPFSAVAILANGLPRIYGNLRLRKVVTKRADIYSEPDPVVKKEIFRVVKRTLPNVIYFAISGQITIWILSFFSDISSIATIGALGRFVIVFTLVKIMIDTLLVPRFARLPNEKKKVMGFFLMTQVVLYIVCICIMLFVYFFPGLFLFILGKDYYGFDQEFIVIMLAAAISLISSSTGNLITSRGAILNPFVLIGVNVSALIIAIFLFDLTNVKGVVCYSILSSSIIYTIVVSFGIYKFSKITT